MLPINTNNLKQSLLKQVQQNNPQGFQFVNQIMQNGGNINPIIKQMLGKITPEQKQQVLNTAKNYGCPDTFLSQLQNLK